MGIHVRLHFSFTARSREIKNCTTPLCSYQPLSEAWLAMALSSHVAKLTRSPSGAWFTAWPCRAWPQPPGPAEAPLPAELVLPAACSVVVRPPGHTDALSHTVAFILHLVNSSSSRDFQQWKICVCHMSCLSWTSWQVRLGAEIPLLLIIAPLS